MDDIIHCPLWYNRIILKYDVDVTGLVTGLSSHTGSLVGWISGSEVKSSYAIGEVVSNGDYVGGLVGLARFTDISRSHAKVSVVGGGDM